MMYTDSDTEGVCWLFPQAAVQTLPESDFLWHFGTYRYKDSMLYTDSGTKGLFSFFRHDAAATAFRMCAS